MITFESILLRGLLSFGWEGTTLNLRGLNLLIGPNASGKSNLIEAPAGSLTGTSAKTPSKRSEQSNQFHQ